MSRSLSACEGALLVVDASQVWRRRRWPTATPHWIWGGGGAGAEQNDLPNADPDNAKAEIEDVIGIDATDAIPLFGQDRHGRGRHPEAVVARIPPPKGNPMALEGAMIVDSWYDAYVGVVMLVRGRWQLTKGDRIKMMATGAMYNADNLGVFTPHNVPRDVLNAGEVGYIIAGIKELQLAKVGDTVTLIKPGTGGAASRPPRPCLASARCSPGVCRPVPHRSQRVRPVARCAGKLKLNDAALHYEPEVSQALGFISRGFWGSCTWRSCRSAWMSSIRSHHHRPSVVYQWCAVMVRSSWSKAPRKCPSRARSRPSANHRDRTPLHATGLCGCRDDAGQPEAWHADPTWRTTAQAMLTTRCRWVKSCLISSTSSNRSAGGTPSMDYEFWAEYRASDVVKVDILLNGEKVDALSIIVHRTQAQYRGRAVAAKMREIISRQMFDGHQAAIGANIIARETIKALRKNVLAKCYGGDITRKRKLLENRRPVEAHETDWLRGSSPGGLSGHFAGGRLMNDAINNRVASLTSLVLAAFVA